MSDELLIYSVNEIIGKKLVNILVYHQIQISKVNL